MSLYRVTTTVVFVVFDAAEQNASGETQARYAGQVLVELGKLADDVDGQPLPGDEPGTWQVSSVTEADTPTGAVLAATSDLRAAAHAIGAYTVGWPSPEEWHVALAERAVTAQLVSAARPPAPVPPAGPGGAATEPAPAEEQRLGMKVRSGGTPLASADKEEADGAAAAK